MFTVTWDKSYDAWDSGGREGRIYWETARICDIRTWGFYSCAVFLLEQWSGNIRDKDVNAFFDFIAGLDEDWQPEEAYFLLSSSQLSYTWAKQLTDHSCVKQVDSFENKAHGPNKVSLFRWSAAKDFS